jgi:hypothetical protein
MRIILFSFLLLCKFSLPAQNVALDTNHLYNCWTHSAEENEAGWEVRIYRPCTYKEFPVLRFRFTMKLRRDGSCDWLYLAPNDAHHMKSGTWQCSIPDRTLKIFDDSDKLVLSYQIESLEKNLMVLKPL